MVQQTSNMHYKDILFFILSLRVLFLFFSRSESIFQCKDNLVNESEFCFQRITGDHSGYNGSNKYTPTRLRIH